MKQLLGIRVTAIMVMFVLIIFAIVVIEYQQTRFNQYTQEEIRRDAHRELAVIRSNLEADIYSDIFYANSLATLASVSPQSTTDQWEKIANELFSKAKHLRNLGMAPDDVIRFVYPTKGNEAALGLDFRTIPAQWRTVQIAREQKSIFLAGPVNLVQGGIGLIARTPIFTDPPVNEQYWGTCSVVIDLEGLFREAGVFLLEESYHFAIRGKDGKGELGEVFWGSEQVFRGNFVSERVSLPSGTWQMAVALDSAYEELPWYKRYASRIIGYPVMLFLIATYLIIYYLYHIAHQNSLQDELTKLPNRRYFMYTLDHMVEEMSRKGCLFALLNLDLVKFKSVNDTYGHAIGDRVLIEVARRIKRALRSSDVVARVGGDEYLVILPRISKEEDVKAIVSKLEREISEDPIRIGYTTIYISVSIGHAIYRDAATSADDLLREADELMYEIKHRMEDEVPQQ